jgi:5-methylcytosine-specific restriction enzyme subunit McrC
VNIPIRNLYYLLLYAWDRLEASDVVRVNALPSEQPVDLLAYVLARSTERVMRQGLDRGYVHISGTTARIRGRIDFGASIRSGALSRSRLHCQFDELSYDVLHNRILKTTLRQLSEAEGLNSLLRGELLRLYDRMDVVSETHISAGIFKRVHLDRNNRFYGLLMSVCALAHEGLIVDQETGARKFQDFIRDEVRMRLLFQNFVKNLLRRRLSSRYTVSAKRIEWQRALGRIDDLRYLPTMNTDVVVEIGNRSLVIDTKYTAKALTVHYAVERVRTEHLYQLFAYLKNYAELRREQKVEGLLLYPRAGDPLDVSFSVMGHQIRLATLDLDQQWEQVESDLVALVTG